MVIPTTEFVMRARISQACGRQIGIFNPHVDPEDLDSMIEFNTKYSLNGKTTYGPKVPFIEIDELVYKRMDEPGSQFYFVDASQTIDNRFYVGLIAPKKGVKTPQKPEDMEPISWAPMYSSMDAWANGEKPFALLRARMNNDELARMMIKQQIFLIEVRHTPVIHSEKLVEILSKDTDEPSGKTDLLKNMAGNIKVETNAPKHHVSIHFEGLSSVFAPLRRIITTMIQCLDSLDEDDQKTIMEEYTDNFVKLYRNWKKTTKHRFSEPNGDSLKSYLKEKKPTEENQSSSE